MQRPAGEKVEHVSETVTISSESSSTTPVCTSTTLTSIFYLGCLHYWEFLCWSIIIHVLIIHVLSIHVLLFVVCSSPCFIICRNLFFFFLINYHRVKVFFSPVFCRFKTFQTFYCNLYSLCKRWVCCNRMGHL